MIANGVSLSALVMLYHNGASSKINAAAASTSPSSGSTPPVHVLRPWHALPDSKARFVGLNSTVLNSLVPGLIKGEQGGSIVFFHYFHISSFLYLLFFSSFFLFLFLFFLSCAISLSLLLYFFSLYSTRIPFFALFFVIIVILFIYLFSSKHSLSGFFVQTTQQWTLKSGTMRSRTPNR